MSKISANYLENFIAFNKLLVLDSIKSIKKFQLFGFSRSNEDPNLYYYRQNGKMTLVLFYVHDILVTRDNEEFIGKLKQQMM